MGMLHTRRSADPCGRHSMVIMEYAAMFHAGDKPPRYDMGMLHARSSAGLYGRLSMEPAFYGT